MNISELKAGMKIKAVGDWADACWKDGDVLEVKVDKAGVFVGCSAGKHYLDGTADDDGSLPFVAGDPTGGAQ